MNLAAPARARVGSVPGHRARRMQPWYEQQLNVRRGRLSSGFIQLAQETGLIELIGEWVLREACRQCHAWQVEGIALPCLAVNLSARQFRQRGFVARLATICPPWTSDWAAGRTIRSRCRSRQTASAAAR
jgi:hypothetical protein